MSDEKQRDSKPTLFPKSVNGETVINAKFASVVMVAIAFGSAVFSGGIVRGDITHTIEAVADLDETVDEHDERIDAIDQRLSADTEWRTAMQSKLENAVSALGKNTEQITRLVTELELTREARSRRNERDRR